MLHLCQCVPLYPHRFMLLRCESIFSYYGCRVCQKRAIKEQEPPRAAFVHVQAKEIVSLSPTELETVSFRLHYAPARKLYIGAIELFSSIPRNKQMKDLFRHIEFSLRHVVARRAKSHFSPVKLDSGIHPLAYTQPYHPSTARYPH